MKVADVGVAKHENEITGTICGTSIYLAPEVFENRIYNSKADMYSFGYVLWELWYGETAFGATAKTPQNMLLEEVTKRNLRPTHIEGTRHPWRNWQHVMASCWNKDPKLRLTAQKGWEQLQNREVFQKTTSPSPPPEPPKFSTLSPPSLPLKSPLLRLGRPMKAMPKEPKGIPVSYHRETEAQKRWEQLQNSEDFQVRFSQFLL